MSLDISIKDPTATYDVEELADFNITHNLTEMADACGLYELIWRPYKTLKHYNVHEGDTESEYKFEDNNDVIAKDIVEGIIKGYAELLSNPVKYKEYNPSNGWGSYDGFCNFLTQYIKALNEYPLGIIKCYR